MSNRVYSNAQICSSVNSILCEFNFGDIESRKQLIATVLVEIILFGTLKALINSLIRKAKDDEDLAREISSIVNEKIQVRILSDERIFSFESENIIWVSDGLIKLLSREQLISVMLHEIGHGEEKLKILYNHLTKNPRNPKKYKFLFSTLAYLAKNRGVVTDPMMMTRVYLITYIIYTSIMENPFKGLYRWSYSDLAIQYGYWDEYESSITLINRYIDRQDKSKLALKIAEVESKEPGTIDKIQRDLFQSAGSNSDNIEKEVLNLSSNQKEKLSRSFIGNFLRSIF